jgi:hypothetical protein
MELFDHIRKISFGFFATIGLLHFVAGLMFVNGYFSETSGLINRISFIPFVLATLVYGFSNLKCYMLGYDKSYKWLDYTLMAVFAIVFIGLLTIEFLVIDA